MAIQAEPASVRGEYARQTQRRMESLADRLQAIALSEAGCMDALWSQLHKQEEASRRAGFAGISRLCRQMQVYLKEAQEGGQTHFTAAAKAMPAVCRAIQVHALATEKRLPRHGCLVEAD